MVCAILAEMPDVNQQGKKQNIYGLSQELKQDYFRLKGKKNQGKNCMRLNLHPFAVLPCLPLSCFHLHGCTCKYL